jgi:hypothetical protein
MTRATALLAAVLLLAGCDSIIDASNAKEIREGCTPMGMFLNSDKCRPFKERIAKADSARKIILEALERDEQVRISVDSRRIDGDQLSDWAIEWYWESSPPGAPTFVIYPSGWDGVKP